MLFMPLFSMFIINKEPILRTFLFSQTCCAKDKLRSYLIPNYYHKYEIPFEFSVFY